MVKKPTKTAVTAEIRKIALERGMPLYKLAEIARGNRVRVGPQAGPAEAVYHYPTFQEQVRACELMLPYVMPKLGVLELTGNDGGPLEIEHSATAVATAIGSLLREAKQETKALPPVLDVLPATNGAGVPLSSGGTAEGEPASTERQCSPSETPPPDSRLSYSKRPLSTQPTTADSLHPYTDYPTPPPSRPKTRHKPDSEAAKYKVGAIVYLDELDPHQGAAECLTPMGDGTCYWAVLKIQPSGEAMELQKVYGLEEARAAWLEFVETGKISRGRRRVRQ